MTPSHLRLREISRLVVLLLLGAISQPSRATQPAAPNVADWQLGPFVRDDGADILGPNPESTFHHPMQKQDVPWEDKQVLCAAAAVKDGKVYLLYRAENRGPVKTSRIGLAISEDGRHFKRQPTPMLYPDEDACKVFEWPGGSEDSRVVGSEDGTYVMTYTAYDGKRPRLFVATSTDLFHWQKHGSACARLASGKYADLR